MKEQKKISIIENQLNAYNAKDIEEFMKYWHHEARLFIYPDELVADGENQIRERHILRFQEKDLFARLISRKCYGEFVVDQEEVIRNLPEGKAEIDVFAIYELFDDKITTARFLSGKPRFFE